MAILNRVQIVEEEFKLTAAKLGVTGPEASALAHQWASPEATGVPMTPTDSLEDSARQEHMHRLPPTSMHRPHASQARL